jgi:hypothetical protein
VSTLVPRLFTGLADDAAVFPPGSAPLADAVAAHRVHRAAWYAPMVGPLLLPPADLAAAAALLPPGERLTVGLIGERTAVTRALAAVPDSVNVRQVESPVAKRGEDPMPGLKEFVASTEGVTGYAEIPLTAGLLGALDEVAVARAAGADIAPKFRTGGLAAELFPTPVELAGVICACRDRGLPFKLTAGLHRAVRHTDPETGFVHHGFVNVLAAALVAADGGGFGPVTDALGAVDPLPLVEVVRARLGDDRPLWIGFGTCSVSEPLEDLTTLGLLVAP